jgi:hypothetical protein
MGTRTFVSLLLAALALTACGEQQQPESVAGPSLAGGKPTDPAVCDPGSLNSLIAGYFPGNYDPDIKALKDALIAAGAETTNGLNAGFAILKEIGNLSRNDPAADLDAGNLLAQGIIKCTFNAKNFTPNFPDDAIYNFAPALDAFAGGAFYVRPGGTLTDKEPVQGALDIDTETPNIQSGVAPLGTATWTSILSDNTLSGGKALIYGYQVDNDPFTYEWATIPPAATFNPGATVALCDGDASNLMIHESNIGILAFQSAGGICAAAYSLVLKETGWGPRALAARLARVVVDALQPAPVQAATVGNLGTGGTASTFKSRITKDPVSVVTIKYTIKPLTTFKVGQTISAEARATTPVGVNNVITGVNGVCLYIFGSNNNGVNTALVGSHDSRCARIEGAVDDYTESKNLEAGYANFSYAVTKVGGLVQTVTTADDTGGQSGVVGRNGQTFIPDQAKSNVRP